ncbi:hypothetical protein [Halobellus ruber]|uniref:Uncharacterized protein n=1 Tax=Halobellus ruber TaxID=2761102 RepID=A0A7J9SIZ6_9EURY|nr:hypothetical protein [Halobellus ruber]MBB6646089.1 hypothetical protein [Halobellus ruber]
MLPSTSRRPVRAAALFRALARTDTETLPYTALYSRRTVSTGRVCQVIGELADAVPVRPFGPTDERRVEPTQAGCEFYEAGIAVQTRLAERVSEPGTFSNDSVDSGDDVLIEEREERSPAI